MKLINTIIAKRIINKYKQDMGNYFDFVQGNEEDIYNDALAIVEKADTIDDPEITKYNDYKEVN